MTHWRSQMRKRNAPDREPGSGRFVVLALFALAAFLFWGVVRSLP